MRKEPRTPLNIPILFGPADQKAPGIIANLSLNGIFILTPHPSRDPLVFIDFDLPGSYQPLNLMAKVVRAGEQGVGARLIGIDSSALALLWSCIQRHLCKEKQCPYCGHSFLEVHRPAECPQCGYYLAYEDPHYLERRDAILHRKTLTELVPALSDSQVKQVLDLVKGFHPGPANGEENGNGDFAEEMIGTCDQMKEIFHLIRKVATTEAPVLITGPSGTGKEMTARAIHERSLRKDGPLVVINCGAIPENLLESELFGHEKGAFTGAHKQVKGKIEYADGGTLFLDEVGELPFSLQVKLLRFLQDHTIERVGGRRGIPVDVRVLAATNVDLEAAVAQGKFREDLYYRLQGIRINMPPLKERGEDVVIMAEALLQQYARKVGKEVRYFTPESLVVLRAYAWPGNVRELINRIRRAVILAEQKWVTPEDLDLGAKRLPLSSSGNTKGFKEAKEEFEFNLIQKVLALHQGEVNKAARALKISRSNLYHLMKKFKIGNLKEGQDGELED